MDEIRYRGIEPELNAIPNDPKWLAAFIETWEVAKHAYGEVLRAGIHRPDAELVRDGAYQQLLRAGLQIHRLGGSEAVGVVSTCLGRCHQEDSTLHFQRLWNGLVPKVAH